MAIGDSSARPPEPSPLSLPARLSMAFVAFTIEVDNEFERRMPHRTAKDGRAFMPGIPWLVSLAMWWTCMRFVGADEVPVVEVERLAGMATNLNGMARWGYVVLREAEDRSGTRRRVALIRATGAGLRARDLWGSLLPEIEERWRVRFGADALHELRESLVALIRGLPSALPDALPILGYGFVNHIRDRREAETGGASALAEPASSSISTLLSKPLLMFALNFERESDYSLAVCTNVLRPIGDDGVRVRDLPGLAGVSKEAIAGVLGVLRKTGAAVVEPDPAGGRAPMVRLTEKGKAARAGYVERVAAIEARWREKFGDGVARLERSLDVIVGECEESPALLSGVVAPPGSWRATLRRPRALPRFPMVLHRGGFPDGA